MNSFLKPTKNKVMTAAQAAGPTKLSPEVLEAFGRAVETAKTAPIVSSAVARTVHDGPSRKNRKHNLKTGMIFGYLILRGKAGIQKGVKTSLKELWRVECLAKGCTTGTFVVPKYYLTRPGNPKTHCGCQFKTLKSTHQREYRIYHMMHQRCMNPNHESYKHYKDRGIGIYEPWQKHNEDGFALWLADIGPCPSPKHSLDRIRNAKGYEPGNIKWSTASDQRINQGDLIGGKTLEEIAELNMTEDEWVEHVKKHGYQ